MTATELGIDVDVQLDQQTKDELAPVCEVFDYWLTPTFIGVVERRLPCDKHADWVIRYHCDCPKTGIALTCTPHLTGMRTNGSTCLRCRTTQHIDSVETL